MLEGIPHLDPHLPPPWKALRFRLRYRGALLRVDITRRGLSVTLEEAGTEPVALCLGCEPVTLTEPGETRETKRGRTGGNAVNQA
jgi:trehalose/maltose hydrolase-like predicted phosphorylase